MTRLSFIRMAIAAALLTNVLPVAADSLSGKIKDPHGAIVPQATVTLYDRASGTQRQSTSSAMGEYRFDDLAPGAYLLEAHSNGSALSTSEDVTVAGTFSHDVTLSVAPTTTRVSVTATQTPLNELEIAKAIDVIDRADIELRDEYSVSAAVRNVPGIRVRQQEGPGGLTSIVTRGMRAQDTAVLIDGLRFRDATGLYGDATAFLEDMDVTDVSRIEVLRGAGSTLYGTNAIGGVLNVTSGEGGGHPHFSVRTEGGGLGFFRGTANAAGGADHDRLVYSAGVSHVNAVNGLRGDEPYRNTSVQAFAKFQLAPRMSLTGRVWRSGAFLRGVEDPAFTSAILANYPASGAVPAIALPESQVKLYAAGLPFNAGNATFIPSVANPDASRSSSFLAAAAIFTHELTANTSYRVSYQGVNTHRANQDGPLGPGSFESFDISSNRFDGHTDTVQARLDSRIGRMHQLTAGYEFERQTYLDIESGAHVVSIDPRIHISELNHAFFGQDQMHWFDGRLQVALSGRIQTFQVQDLRLTGAANPYAGVHIDNPDNAYTGDISAAYFLRGSQTKLRGHVGNSYRAPSLYERFGTSYFGGFYGFYGDPRLKPERAVAFDGGIDQWLMGSKLRLSATYFYTDLHEIIDFTFSNFPVNDPFGRFGGYINSKGGGISRGAELSAQFSPTSKTSLQLGYTYTNSDHRLPTIGTNFYQTLFTSPHQFTATATQWVTPRLHVTLDWFVASQYSLSPYGANGRRLVFSGPNKTDIVAGYRIPLNDTRSIEVYGKLENAFDVRYFEGGTTTPGIWGIGGLKFNF